MFDRARVVWADIGRGLRATVLEPGDPSVPLNTCYVIRCHSTTDALALCTLLNSPLASAWLSVVAEQARGGYRRYLGWTMSLFPIPQRWTDCRDSLAALGKLATANPRDARTGEILDAAIASYDLRRKEIDPLLAWTAE